MGPKTEILAGCASVSLACGAEIFHEVYFVLSFIAVFSGAILGIHGLYQLARSKRDK